MAELKTKPTDQDATEFLHTVEDEQKRLDSFEILKIMKKVTKEKPRMWGTSIVGFGMYHYKSERSTQEGDWPLIGFSPRKKSLTLYLMPGFVGVQDLLKKLGKHKTTVGCLYIKRLSDVDIDVLTEIITHSFQEANKKYAKA